MIVNTTEETTTPVEKTTTTQDSQSKVTVSDSIVKEEKTTDPIVQEKKTTDPDPVKKLDQLKAKQWVIDFYKSKGQEIDDASATKFSQHKNIKLMMTRQYRMTGTDIPKQEELDKLYNSWEVDIDIVDEVLQNSTILNPEKKNPFSTTVLQNQGQNTESISDLEDGSSSSGYEGFFNGDKSYQENISKIPESVLSLDSGDAVLILNNTLKQYGVNVTPGSADNSGDGITITRPDGESASFSMFNDSYKSRLQLVNPDQNPEELQRKRYGDMINFINQSKSENLGFQTGILQNADAAGLPDAIEGYMNGALTPSTEELNFIMGLLPGKRKTTDYFLKDGSFKHELWKFDVQRADTGLYKHKLDQNKEDTYLQGVNKAQDNTAIKPRRLPSFDNLDPSFKLNEKSESRNRKEALKKIKDIATSFNKRKTIASSNLGSAMRVSGAYKKVDLNNPVSIANIRQAGLLPGDLPMDQILINGNPSSVNEISTMMYDYETIQRIREGKIKIEIGDPKTAGLLANQVAQIKDLIRTQEATDNKGVLGFDNGITDWLSEASETIEGGVTELALSSWELASNMAYIGFDSLVGMGVPELAAQEIMYGNMGLPGVMNVKKLLDPDYVKHTRREYQPVFEGGLLDSKSFAEGIYKSSTAISQSLVYTGLFIANPVVGLTATGLGSYGGDRVSQNSARKELKEKQELGFALSPDEQTMLNQSGAMSRLNSLTKAGVEVGVTSLFTFKYFKGLKSANKFTGPKTAENAKKIADAYAKNVRQSVAGKMSRALGIDKKAVLAELPEENIIALTNYYVDVQFGLDVWDFERAKKLMKETSLVSIISGTGMGIGGKIHSQSKIKKVGEQQVKNNMNLPAENEAIVNKLNVDAQVNQIEKQSEQGLVDLKNNVEYKTLKDLQSKADLKVQKFDDMKQDLVSRMNVREKSKFLDILRQIEQQDGNITSEDTSNNVKKQSEKNIIDLKAKAKGILSKYPSDMSFYFAENSVQQDYLGQAVEIIGKEKADAGEKDFTVNSNDPAVFDRAAKLHTQAVADGIVIARQNANAASNIGINSANDFLVEVDRQELKDWSLSNDLMTVKDMLGATELDLNIDDNKDNKEDAPIEKDENGNVVVGQPLAPVKTEAEVKKERTSAIVNRIESLNVDSDFANDLAPKQYKEVKSFFDNLKNGNKVSFGKIESILDAHDIALQIRSNSSGKIRVGAKLKGVLNSDGSLTEKGLQMYNQLAQTIQAGAGLNTMTIEGMTLIRDSQIGAPLHNLIQEGLRSSAEAKQKSGNIKAGHTSEYRAEVEAYNKANGTRYSLDPSSDVDTSYEMSILSMLRREVGEKNQDGVDIEFSRAKNLIIEELAKRKEDSEDPKVAGKLARKRKYKEYKAVVERLGVSDASSFDDVSSKALPFNLNAITRLSEVMPGQRALDRINDFENYEAFKFEEGSYTPIFMSKASDGSKYNDYFGPTSFDGIGSNSGKNVTRPESLGTDLRLNPGLYWDSAYGQLNGMEMEISGKKHYETLDNLLQNPTFKNSFEDGALKDLLLNSFSKRSAMWKDDVKSSNLSPTDIGDTKIKTTLQKTVNALYGGISAISLTRLTQPMSQFTSAWAGTFPIVKSKQARSYLKKRGLSFFTGTAGSFNANNKVGRALGYFDSMGKLGNIYEKSRTGLRNALSSQLAIDPNKSMPADYYIKNLNLTDAQGRVLQEASSGVQLTIDRVLETIGKSNELALEFLLANSDKAAANMAFETHYLDYKIEQGENVGDLDAFWEKENANPDLEAIKYADAIVDRTMRQSDPAGESRVYSSDIGKNGMRFAMPFQKFILNAKADFSNQISILQDPNISELQKQDARRFMKGKLNEIVSFNAVKYAGSVATLKGLSGLLALGMDEDDVYENGGMEGDISSRLGITSDKDDLDALTSTVQGATSIEERNAAQSALSGFREMQDVVDGFQQYAMNYDNKFETGKTYPIIGSTIQDAVQTLNPTPVMGFMNDMMAWSVNSIYGEDIAREFSSRGFDEPLDTDTGIDMILKKSGLLGIGLEITERIRTAHTLRKNGTVIVNKGDYKNTERYLTAPNDAMRQKLANAVDFLYQVRIHSIMNPIAPRADLDKYGDKLERTIEKYFLQTKPDQNMQRIMGMQGPLQEED